MGFRERIWLWMYWRNSFPTFGLPAPWEAETRERILSLPAAQRMELLLAAMDRLGSRNLFGARLRLDPGEGLCASLHRALQRCRNLLRGVLRRERPLDDAGRRWGMLVSQLAHSLRHGLGDRDIARILREMDRHESQGCFDPLLRTLRRVLRAEAPGTETTRALAAMDPESHARRFLDGVGADA